jgi:AbrB family looped-hinge helix DNA binding protein
MINKHEVKKMPLIKVKQNFQITLPNTLRKYLNIAVGDYMEVDKQDGELVLKPVKVVHQEQAYFYTKEWQKGEAEADKDIANGDVLGPFDNITDGLAALKTAKI